MEKQYDNDFFKEEKDDATDFSLIKGDTMQQVEDLEEELKRKG
ncbi:D-alanyl-D-alanine carboxypeptidase [Bacillus sp. DX1.1]|nr:MULTISPECIES: D-alanyl-D-alanine carboxypeptidase [unclassified Bacillus (in: firmicutes)]MDM5154967.1 D-alanyl-D-alanine carboxypeptidase [Bacillus sp. DX1.1]MDM5188744.1 D-alanyl-D-alanine carboxypeptidase [Bacillus sp. DX4.1]WJE83831.1 D-alanyl-D-alanine carboxypeptidase [Bacillus sp. DX3.1]